MFKQDIKQKILPIEISSHAKLDVGVEMIQHQQGHRNRKNYCSCLLLRSSRTGKCAGEENVSLDRSASSWHVICENKTRRRTVDVYRTFPYPITFLLGKINLYLAVLKYKQVQEYSTLNCTT